MLKSETLLVLGAGASKEVGFPLGLELRDTLATMMEIRYDWRTVTSGDRQLGAFLMGLANRDQQMAQRLHDAALSVVDKLPQVSSIDALLSLLTNEDAVIVAKMAIVLAIARSEASSAVSGESFDKAYFTRLSHTWYGKFFELLHQRVPIDRVDTIFDRLRVLSFNYDRSFEEFLFQALRNLYDLGQNEAAEVMRRLRVVHPYGTIAPLPWQNASGVEYGRVPSLETAETSIRTFSEQVSDVRLQGSIEEYVQSADRVVFLGFGYIPENMAVIAPSVPMPRKPLRGTALGFSKSNQSYVESELEEWLEPIATLVDPDLHDPRVALDSILTCADFVDEYSRFIAA